MVKPTIDHHYEDVYDIQDIEDIIDYNRFISRRLDIYKANNAQFNPSSFKLNYISDFLFNCYMNYVYYSVGEDYDNGPENEFALEVLDYYYDRWSKSSVFTLYTEDCMDVDNMDEYIVD